jgi:hypothetical protein
MAALFLVPALAGSLGLARLGGDARLVVAFLIEAPLVAAGLWWSCRLTLDRFPGWARSARGVCCTVVLLSLFALGQLIKQKQTYPFLAFTMYGTAGAGDVTYFEYEAILRSGRRERFRPSRLQPALGSARVVRGLARRLEESLVNGRVNPDRPSYALFESALRALAGLYNEDYPADPLERVEVFRVTWPPPFSPGQARRQSLALVQVLPG